MRVLIADDHSLFRDGIVSLLEAAEFQVLGQVGNGEDAISEARRLHPQLLLMDINMPKMNGLEALKVLKKEMPDLKVVILTVSDSDDDLFTAMDYGADGFLLKSLTADEFIDLLEGLRQDEIAVTRHMATRLLKRGKGQQRRDGSRAGVLTAREVELLKLVATGLSNRAIAQELSVSPNTVKYHVKNILSKLNVQNRTEAVAIALKQGIISNNRPSKTL